MKKFYAFMACMLVACCAMAFSPRQSFTMQKAQVAPGAIEKMAQARPDLNTMEKIGTFEDTRAGYNWDIFMGINSDRWCDVLYTEVDASGDPIWMPFEELPYYWVSMTFTENNQKIFIDFECFWPTQAMLDHYEDETWWINPGTKEEIFNWEMAEDEYGSLEDAQAPASIESMCAYMLAKDFPMYQYPVGYMPGLYGMMNMLLFQSNSYACIANNNYMWLNGAGISGNYYVFDNAAYLNLTDYDAETSTIGGSFYAPMGAADEDGNVTVRTTITDEFNKQAVMFGFGDLEMEVGEVHILNLGNTEDYTWSDDEGSYEISACFEDFVPSNLYFVVWCDPALTYEGKISEASFTRSPAVKDAEAGVYVDQVNWFSAYVTLDENTDLADPQGIVALEPYDIDAEGYLVNTIKPGMMWSAYYDRRVPDSGVMANLGSYGQYFNETTIMHYTENADGTVKDTTKLGFGDKEAGFNGRIVGDNGAIVVFSYTGKIKFHYEADNFVKAVKEIDAVGTADAKVIEGTTGVDAIIAGSNAETVATQYYNFQGIRLNDAPQHGIYIVREFKADGSVVSKKVAK